MIFKVYRTDVILVNRMVTSSFLTLGASQDLEDLCSGAKFFQSYELNQLSL